MFGRVAGAGVSFMAFSFSLSLAGEKKENREMTYDREVSRDWRAKLGSLKSQSVS